MSSPYEQPATAALITMDPGPGFPTKRAAFAIGLATIYDGRVLDVRFPHTNVGGSKGSAALFWNALQASRSRVAGEIDFIALKKAKAVFDELFADAARDDAFYAEHQNVYALDELFDALGEVHPLAKYGYRYGVVLALTEDFEQPPTSLLDVWLRLTLMSQCRVPDPVTVKFDGAFGILEKLYWTDHGPIVATTNPWQLRGMGVKTIDSADKFPPMLPYVIPDGVRIATGAHVRLGAHLVSDTVLMFGASVNFGSGTLNCRDGGKNKGCMVEGGIANGVFVGDGSQIGRLGGEIGTLTNVGGSRNHVGEGSLIGALAEVGIPIGDNVIIGAGLALMPGTKVAFIENDGTEQNGLRADRFANVPDLMFFGNTQTGRIEVRRLPEGREAVKYNAALFG